MGKKKQDEEAPKLFCPECGSDKVTLTAEQMWMANTMEHYCHSVKPHDGDAKSSCLDCDWRGQHQDLKGYGQEDEAGDPEHLVRKALESAQVVLTSAVGHGPDYVGKKVRDALKSVTEFLAIPAGPVEKTEVDASGLAAAALRQSDEALSNVLGYGPKSLDKKVKASIADVREALELV